MYLPVHQSSGDPALHATNIPRSDDSSPRIVKIQGTSSSGAWILLSPPNVPILSVIRTIISDVGKLRRSLLVLVLYCGVSGGAGLELRWPRCSVHSAYKAVPKRLQAVAVPPQATSLQCAERNAAKLWSKRV